MGLNIKNEETHALASKVAELAGETPNASISAGNLLEAFIVTDERRSDSLSAKAGEILDALRLEIAPLTGKRIASMARAIILPHLISAIASPTPWPRPREILCCSRAMTSPVWIFRLRSRPESIRSLAGKL